MRPKQVPNRYALPGVKWSPLVQSDQAIARLRKEISDSEKALRVLTDPIYRDAEKAFLEATEASLESALAKRKKYDDRMAKEADRKANISA